MSIVLRFGAQSRGQDPAPDGSILQAGQREETEGDMVLAWTQSTGDASGEVSDARQPQRSAYKATELLPFWGERSEVHAEVDLGLSRRPTLHHSLAGGPDCYCRGFESAGEQDERQRGGGTISSYCSDEHLPLDLPQLSKNSAPHIL